MATTTNYGWTTPDNSGLVKNGAQDIRSLGTSIDTFLFRPFSKNAIINGGFDIWQRGTTNNTGVSAYTADRWQKGGATSYGISRQVTGDTTNLPNVQYCARAQRTAGSAVTTVNDFGYSLETADSIRFVGQTVILSFYARAGANYSAASSALAMGIYSGTGTDQNIMTTGLTGQLTVVAGTKTLTTTWQRFTLTGTVSSAATQLALYFAATPTGTAGANDYYEITGVQLEVGSTATPFSRNASTIQGELAACQRYFNRLINKKSVYFGVGAATSTTFAQFAITYPTMRTTPALTVSAVTDFLMTVAAGSGTGAISAISLNSASNEQFAKLEVTCASGLVAGNATTLLSQNANATFDLSSEL